MIIYRKSDQWSSLCFDVKYLVGANSKFLVSEYKYLTKYRNMWERQWRGKFILVLFVEFWSTNLIGMPGITRGRTPRCFAFSLSSAPCSFMLFSCGIADTSREGIFGIYIYTDCCAVHKTLRWSRDQEQGARGETVRNSMALFSDIRDHS